MCGRTACCLCEDRYICASTFYDPTNDIFKKPNWNYSCSLTFCPSVNKAPSEVTPVLMWSNNDHFPVVQPMIWGLIPPWHKGDYKSLKLTTNNARIENLKKSQLYRVPLSHGKRCVVICEGFYEWQTVGKTKQPYFIYNNQPQGMRAEEQSHWNAGEWSEKKGWSGPTLLKMAGLYSEWTNSENEMILSYTVITMESNETLSWLHHRMPAVLSTEEQVKDWLNKEDVSDGEVALSLLEPASCLSWHPVSTAVNNSRNKQAHLNQPINLGQTKLSGSSKLMESWLKCGKREVKTVPTGGNEDDPSKKKKIN